MKIFKFLSLAVSVTLAQQYNGPVDPQDPAYPADPQDPYDPQDPVFPPDGISCWHCDAKNMTHCMDIGEEKPCPENAQSCMVEARKRDGQLETVCFIFKAILNL